MAFESLTSALERHRSLSPYQIHEYPPRPNAEDSSALLKLHSGATSSSGTISPFSVEPSPKLQSRVPGNFIEANEKAGLPSTKDSDGYAQIEAARVVRSHTRKKYFGLSEKPQAQSNRKRTAKRTRTRAHNNGEDPRSRVSTDVEHDGGKSINSGSMTGGVLSALLTLYNQQDLDSASPEHPVFNLPPEEPWISKDDGRSPRAMNEGQHRGRTLSRLAAESTSATTSSRSSSADSRENHYRSGENRSRKRSKLPFSPSVLFSGGKPREARSDAGVFGPLIASTGNLSGVASPVLSGLQPDVKRPGYHLSRFVSSAVRPCSRLIYLHYQ